MDGYGPTAPGPYVWLVLQVISTSLVGKIVRLMRVIRSPIIDNG